MEAKAHCPAFAGFDRPFITGTHLAPRAKATNSNQTRIDIALHTRNPCCISESSVYTGGIPALLCRIFLHSFQLRFIRLIGLHL